MDEATKNRLLRQLPSVEELLSSTPARELVARHGRAALRRAARHAVDAVRGRLLASAEPARDDLPAWLEAEVQTCLRATLASDQAPRLRRVINATGVVLHTGLGRAPLPEQARSRILEVAEGYSNLELDLESGERGTRHGHLAELLTDLVGAESALVVNNCAGAVLLALVALAGDRVAVVSRGELVEIGGGFRLPEVMTLGRVRLAEVGTTNKTRLADYEAALTPDSALLVKVHRSNFTVSGFTEETSLAALSELAHRRAIPLFYDLGSGLLTETTLGSGVTPSEPSVASALRDGADLVAFSGDKLLGGPQAGILVGARALIEKLQNHPLQRALRIDKLTAAALEATLMLYRNGREREIPVLQMLQADPAEIRARAGRLLAMLRAQGVPASAMSVEAVEGRAGGGSLPELALPSVALALRHEEADALSRALREGVTPVVARVSEGALLLDLRTVFDDELTGLAEALSLAWKSTVEASEKPVPASVQGVAHA